jgi:serine/threonine protein kinase
MKKKGHTANRKENGLIICKDRYYLSNPVRGTRHSKELRGTDISSSKEIAPHTSPTVPPQPTQQTNHNQELATQNMISQLLSENTTLASQITSLTSQNTSLTSQLAQVRAEMLTIQTNYQAVQRSNQMLQANMEWLLAQQQLSQFERQIALNQLTEIQPLKVAGLGDFYVAAAPLGCGAFGIVHRVRTNWNLLESRSTTISEASKALWNEVALKMMLNYTQSATPANTQVLKNQFEQEYYFPVLHPHWSIVQVFNYFHSDLLPVYLPQGSDPSLYNQRTAYFTMELGRGHLKEFLEQNPNLNGRERLLIVTQLLVGISHVNSCGFAHLDLKLDNVIWLQNARKMIRGDHFVIGDLGTAKRSPVRVHVGEGILGNLINRSPELWQLFGENSGGYLTVDVSGNDVWAAGCMMFEIFQSRHPFDIPRQPDGLQNRICFLPLPQLDAQWGTGCSKLLDLMWKRTLAERISSWDASRLCGMLLWDFPFRANVTLDDCTQWLNSRKQLLFGRLFQNGERASVNIEEFLELHIVFHSAPDQLLRCARLFV